MPLTPHLIQNTAIVVTGDQAGGGLTTRAYPGQTYTRYFKNEPCNYTLSPGAGPYGANSTQMTLTSGGTQIIYLPFFRDEITSVALPMRGGATEFVTANLSGCAIYLARRANGRLVVFHANTQTGSDRATMTGKQANFQTPAAIRELDGLARGALAPSRSQRFVGSLSKTAYLAGAASASTDNDHFLGGTTVVGLRNGAQWEFWYQCWGMCDGAAFRVIKAERWWRG